MKNLINLIKQQWFVEFIAVFILSLLVFFVGSSIAFNGDILLESLASRLIAIAIIFFIWLSYRLIRYFLARKKEQQLISDLAVGQSSDQALGSEELLILKKKFADALTQLEATYGKKFGNNHYLYQLPWYVIIGAPGSGKTTALVNSGLQFPFKDVKLQGVSGTRNCDWWFTDKAVLIDTAGRYVTQDSHAELDSSAWHAFLQLLKKHRPRRPLNGIIMSISVGDILNKSEHDLVEYAKTMRLRIKELNGQLGIDLPVYIWVTKVDLLSGFAEFFADLTESERHQVWGQTFSWEGNGEPLKNIERFEQEYAILVERLNQKSFKRLKDESNSAKRAAIFEFSRQFVLLKADMLLFLKEAFTFHIHEQPFVLRGVYFTSATQDGTAFDRIKTILQSSFSLEKSPTNIPVVLKGKSYFLTSLLKNVIFPEAELVGVNQVVEQRLQWMKIGLYLGSFAVIFLVILAWIFSFYGNLSAMEEIEKQVKLYQTNKLVNLDYRADFVSLAPKMDALLDAKNVYPHSSSFTGLGLSQGDKLQDGAKIAYEHVLRETFAPLITWRLKERMKGDDGKDLGSLYQLLAVYLMFSETDHMDKAVATAWIKRDWQSLFVTDLKLQASLVTHLQNFLDLPAESVNIDNNFVNAVRSKLTQITQVSQIYSQFKAESLFDHDNDLNVAKALTPNGERVYMTSDGKALSSLVIPGLYTSYGYIEYFIKKGMDYVKQADAQSWVLGSSGNVLNQNENHERLFNDLKRLYLADYQVIWQNQVLSVNLKPVLNKNQLVETLDILSRPDSPLKLLLQTVEKNTALSKLSAEAADALNKVAVSLPVPAAVQKILPKSGLNVIGHDPIAQFEESFESYNAQVRDGGIDATLANIKTVHDQLESTGFLSGNCNPACLAALQSAKRDLAVVPEKVAKPIADMLSKAKDQGGNDLISDLDRQMKEVVTQPCRSLLTGRYPFTKNSPQDVLPADFAKLFKKTGILDDFFNNNLKNYVDVTVSNWTEMSSESPLGLSATALAQFQIASHIQGSFFSAGTTVPQLEFKLKPLELDERIGTFRLNIEGQELVYRHGPEQTTNFKWPGIASNVGVRVVFETLEGKQFSRQKEGAWALFRLFDEANMLATNLPEKYILTISLEGYQARFELEAASVDNPFAMNDFQRFRCPETLRR